MTALNWKTFYKDCQDFALRNSTKQNVLPVSKKPGLQAAQKVLRGKAREKIDLDCQDRLGGSYSVR